MSRLNNFSIKLFIQQSGSITIDYEYIPLYRLTEANYSTGDYYHYTYDAVGNRLTETTQLAVNSYQYDAANRLTSVDGVSYTWDNNGNLLNDGVNTYVYDSANRLTALSNQQSASSYQYSGLGDRLAQSVNGNTTNYTLDLSTGLTQVLNDGTNTYLYGMGRIAQVNTTTEYFLGDALGSVRQLTDASGEITLAKSYQPYGETLVSAGNGTSPFAFTGEQTDVSGLTYLRARYYSSGDGRFLTRDTWMGDYNRPLSLNRWMYVEGNPINTIDPSGHITENQAARADLILEKLRTYNIHVVRDWGNVLRTADPSSLPPFILTGILYNHCEWQDGRWSLNELELVLNTIKRVNLQTHGRLNMLIRPVKVLLTDFSWCPSNWRGCTSWGGTEIRLKDNGLPSPGSDLKQYFKISASVQNFDVFTLVHEIGHAWDMQNGGQYAAGLVRYTGGSYIIRGPSLPLQCHITDVIDKEDLNHKKPGCNDARYRYGGIPSYGADIYFNAGEDFANSFAAYIFPTDAQQVIDAKYNDPSRNPEEYKLNKYLYYSDYTKMPRWIYVNNLVNGFSPGGK